MKVDLLDNRDIILLACNKQGNGMYDLRLPAVDGIESVMLQSGWLGYLDQTGRRRTSESCA